MSKVADDSGGTLVRQRLAWERDFTQIPNVYARDRSLSWVARGILTWLMTHGDGFQITMAQLEQESWKEGREAVRGAVRELEKAGYLHRQIVRSRGGQRRADKWHLLDPFQLPVVGQLAFPLAVDNSPSPHDGNPSSREAIRRVAVDGNPSSKKNTIEEHRSTSAPLDAPVDNFGAVRWSDDRCPANYRDGRHALGQHGMCSWCHERPIVRSVQ